MQTRGAAVTRWGRQRTNIQDAGKHAPPERPTGSQHPLDRQRQARVLHHRCARREICEKVAAERKRGNGKHLFLSGNVTDKMKDGRHQIDSPTSKGSWCPRISCAPRSCSRAFSLSLATLSRRFRLPEAQGLQTSGRPRTGLDAIIRSGKETHVATRCSCGPEGVERD